MYFQIGALVASFVLWLAYRHRTEMLSELGWDGEQYFACITIIVGFTFVCWPLTLGSMLWHRWLR